MNEYSKKQEHAMRDKPESDTRDVLINDLIASKSSKQTDTPMTDAEVARIGGWPNLDASYATMILFCRQLERDLTAANAEAQKAKDQCEYWHRLSLKDSAESAAANEQLKTAQQRQEALNAQIEHFKKMLTERAEMHLKDAAEVERYRIALEEAGKVPEGYVLVPVEPTEEMVNAGSLAGGDWPECVKLAWAAMIERAAAPKDNPMNYHFSPWWIFTNHSKNQEHAMRDKPESDTPRTDAACVSREFIAREMDVYSHKFILADVARQLERDLNAANARLKLYRRWIVNHPSGLPDHACKACVPHSDMLIDGFLCMYHEALKDK